MSLVSSGEIVIVFDSLLTYTERGFQKRGGGGIGVSKFPVC